jgi:hypothetical protein
MNVLARITRAVVVATLVLPLVLLTACSHPAGSRALPPPVTMAFCGGSQQLRPAIVEVICTTNDITARSLIWSAWGKPVATASGTAAVDMCSFEDCHNGSYSAFPIVVIASRIANCSKNTRAYSRLQYTFVGRSPFQGLPTNMKFKNFEVGASRPGPPRNQTVSLTC